MVPNATNNSPQHRRAFLSGESSHRFPICMSGLGAGVGHFHQRVAVAVAKRLPQRRRQLR